MKKTNEVAAYTAVNGEIAWLWHHPTNFDINIKQKADRLNKWQDLIMNNSL